MGGDEPMIDSQRRTVLKAVGTAGALVAVGGIGTASARQGKREGASAGSTIFDIVEESDDFTILELALEETELDAVLDADGRQYTVFAPTDAAFQALLDADPNDGLEEPGDVLALPNLADILLYHVTTGRRYAASVVDAPQVKMLNGDTVAVDGTVLNDGQATIVGTNIEASNGVAHVINGVLLP